MSHLSTEKTNPTTPIFNLNDHNKEAVPTISKGDAARAKMGKPDPEMSFARVHTENPVTIYVVEFRRVDSEGRFRELLYSAYIPALKEQLDAALSKHLKTITLYPCKLANGSDLMLVQRHPKRKITTWHTSMQDVINQSKDNYVQMRTNKKAQMYELEVVGAYPGTKLEYPTFLSDVQDAFADTYITSMDHPIVRELLAEEHKQSGFDDIALNV